MIQHCTKTYFIPSKRYCWFHLHCWGFHGQCFSKRMFQQSLIWNICQDTLSQGQWMLAPTEMKTFESTYLRIFGPSLQHDMAQRICAFHRSEKVRMVVRICNKPFNMSSRRLLENQSSNILWKFLESWNHNAEWIWYISSGITNYRKALSMKCRFAFHGVASWNGY